MTTVHDKLVHFHKSADVKQRDDALAAVILPLLWIFAIFSAPPPNSALRFFSSKNW